jgi:hypothetical protein
LRVADVLPCVYLSFALIFSASTEFLETQKPVFLQAHKLNNFGTLVCRPIHGFGGNQPLQGRQKMLLHHQFLALSLVFVPNALVGMDKV